MPDITMTRQTSLRGRPLQDAVNAMVASMGRRSPFNLAPIQPTWESGSRLTFTASAMGQQQANGSIDIRDGSPSTVTAQVNLLTSMSRGYRADVERAMVEESERNMPIVGGSAQTQTPAQTSTQSTSTGSRSSARNDFDWNLLGDILTNVVGTTATSVSTFNQAVGYTANAQAKQIAAETVAVSKAPAPSPTIVRSEPSSEPVAPAVSSALSASTIGWIILGVLGLGAIGLVVAIIAKKKPQPRSRARDEE